jgi:hypothetical protein
MKLDLITREELAKELRVCPATLDIWRKKYFMDNNKFLPGEVRFGNRARTVRFKKDIIFNHFFGEA